MDFVNQNLGNSIGRDRFLSDRLSEISSQAYHDSAFPAIDLLPELSCHYQFFIQFPNHLSFLADQLWNGQIPAFPFTNFHSRHSAATVSLLCRPCVMEMGVNARLTRVVHPIGRTLG
jgi:hypothetical protein